MREVFTQKLAEYGMEHAAEQMSVYADKLLKINEVMNLTRITDHEEVAVKHFIDSAHPEICRLLPENAKVIDIGTGGGFPGVPLKLMREDIHVTFLESAAKKLNFVETALKDMGIDAMFENKRAEECPELRESYDIAVSRAVAALPMLLELTSQFVKVGGYVLAYKGAIADEELAAAKGAIKKLNLTLEERVDINIEGNSHCILKFKKTAATPKQYPRRFAQIKKSPL